MPDNLSPGNESVGSKATQVPTFNPIANHSFMYTSTPSTPVKTPRGPPTTPINTKATELLQRFGARQTHCSPSYEQKVSAMAERDLRRRSAPQYRDSDDDDDDEVKDTGKTDRRKSPSPSEFGDSTRSEDTDVFVDNPSSSKPMLSSMYSDNFEDMDWSIISRPRSLPKPFERSDYTESPSAIGDDDDLYHSSSNVRMTSTGKTLRSRDALTSSAALLGRGYGRDYALAASPIRRRTAAPSKKGPVKLSLRQQRILVLKSRRDRFIYENRSVFLPLLPNNNYVEKLTASSIGISDYVEVVQPTGINATLKPYQLKGLSFLVHMHENGMPAILGDEMGLGKTLQTLALFQHLKNNETLCTSESRPFLVICPLTVLENWVSEARKFTPGLRVLRFHGPIEERNLLKDLMRKKSSQSKRTKQLINSDIEQARYDLVVTTYDAFKAEASWFKTAFAWQYAVLDEGHIIKNYKSALSKSLQSLGAEHRLLLTGTPLQNNLVELWSILHWLLADVFGDKSLPLFKNAFDLTKGSYDRQALDDSRRLLELFMLRRMKSSPGVNLNLPPKKVVRLFVPLTDLQKRAYMQMLTLQSDDMLEQICRGAESKEKSSLDEDHTAANVTDSSTTLTKAQKQDDHRRLLNLVLQLRKICNHPYLMDFAAPEVNLLGPHVYENSGKFMALYKLLQEIVIRRGNKVIIFSQFIEVLDWVHDLLSYMSEEEKLFKVVRLDGNTVRAKRNLYVRLFQQRDSAYKVFLISTKAGGVGLTLTAATSAIFIDEDWNPQVDLQAEARCHRIGQTQPVTIYKLCTADTVEEQMLGRIHKKLFLSAKIMEAMQNRYDGAQPEEDEKSLLVQCQSLFGNYAEFSSILRRGTKTLTNSADANELLGWDFDTMIKKCTQTSIEDISSDASANSEESEEAWLATMERVECAVFEGKRYAREQVSSTDFDTPNSARKDRHKGKEVTVCIDGYMVNKESLACVDGEAPPTFAGKDPTLKDVKRTKDRVPHQDHCQACYSHEDPLIECDNCPRVLHPDCLSEEAYAAARRFGTWSCPQHACAECNKKASEAGGMIFRCRWCPRSFCEDCTDWPNVELVGDTLDEYRFMGFGIKREAYYISCPRCNDPLYREARQESAMYYADLMEKVDSGELEIGGEEGEEEPEGLGHEADEEHGSMEEMDVNEELGAGGQTKRKASYNDSANGGEAEDDGEEDEVYTPTPAAKKHKHKHQGDAWSDIEV